MTVSNPNPLANPLNDRQFGNLSFSRLEANGYFRPNKNANLPETEFDFAAYQAYQDSLHVPDTATDSYSDITIAQQNYKTINGVRTICLDDPIGTWNDREIMRSPQTQQNQPSPVDIKYNRMLAQKNAELCANMSDYQKQLLSDIESYIGKSKLVEESKKLV